MVRLGEPVRVITEPGLHFKIPLIDSVIYIDKRILDLENPGAGGDRLRPEAARGRRVRALQINNLLQFYQTVGSVERANSQLSILLNSALRRVLGEATLTHVVRDERAQLMARVRDQLDTEAQAFGIAVVDVRIRRADLPEQNSQAVYERMKTERQHEAAEFRAQGSQRAQEIRARADRDVTVLLADATADGRAGPRRGRRRAQPHLRRRLWTRSRVLRVLSLDAGLRSRPAAERYPHAAQARFGVLPILRAIRRASRVRWIGRRRTRRPARSEVARATARSRDRSKMPELIVAIGLVFVIEGLVFAAFPGAAKRLAATALESPENSLRIAGIVSAVLGVVLIWLVRG